MSPALEQDVTLTVKASGTEMVILCKLIEFTEVQGGMAHFRPVHWVAKSLLSFWLQGTSFLPLIICICCSLYEDHFTVAC